MYIYFHGTWSPGTTTGDNSRRQGVKVASVYPCIRDPLSTNHETSHCDDERGSILYGLVYLYLSSVLLCFHRDRADD